ncbi:MAG: ribosome-associated translation inhibitor RaiA [Planctomycetes bacterium]|nr:ribosome-associated translation inhibitor RaiA [Planctomycetota bacterium]
MQVIVSARHGQLSTATQEKVTEKVEKLRRFFDRITRIEVTVNLENREAPHVEVCVSAEHTSDFVASDTGELSASIDSVVHKLEQQLRKHKEKIQDGHRKPGRKQLEPPAVDDTADDGEAEE